MAVALLSPSDANRVGYAEGQFDLATESKAIKKFYACVSEKKKEPESCWQDQVEWTKVVYRTWDAMTDQQKIEHVPQSKWAEILRGKADSKVMPKLPVEINEGRLTIPKMLTVPPDEMRQFKGRIICGRCGNNDWTKFTYMLPMDDRVLVQCSSCGLTFFKEVEPSENNAIQK